MSDSLNREHFFAFTRVRRKNPHTGGEQITYVAKFVVQRPSTEQPSHAFKIHPRKGASEGNRLRTDPQVIAGVSVSLTDTAHGVGWYLVSCVIDPERTTLGDFDAELVAWALDSQSRSDIKTLVWKLAVRKPTPDSEIVVPPTDWGKLARPVSEIESTPLPPPRPTFWHRALRTVGLAS